MSERGDYLRRAATLIDCCVQMTGDLNEAAELDAMEKRLDEMALAATDAVPSCEVCGSTDRVSGWGMDGSPLCYAHMVEANARIDAAADAVGHKCAWCDTLTTGAICAACILREGPPATDAVEVDLREAIAEVLRDEGLFLGTADLRFKAADAVLPIIEREKARAEKDAYQRGLSDGVEAEDLWIAAIADEYARGSSDGWRNGCNVGYARALVAVAERIKALQRFDHIPQHMGLDGGCVSRDAALAAVRGQGDYPANPYDDGIDLDVDLGAGDARVATSHRGRSGANG